MPLLAATGMFKIGVDRSQFTRTSSEKELESVMPVSQKPDSYQCLNTYLSR